jgi:hypothetical protein
MLGGFPFAGSYFGGGPLQAQSSEQPAFLDDFIEVGAVGRMVNAGAPGRFAAVSATGRRSAVAAQERLSAIGARGRFVRTKRS